MTTEITPVEHEEEKVNVRVQGGSSGAVYGLGLIGACIFYMGRAVTPREKAIGFLKAMVWPVFVVKELLEFLTRSERRVFCEAKAFFRCIQSAPSRSGGSIYQFKQFPLPP
jgi:hypothetical protein